MLMNNPTLKELRSELHKQVEKLQKDQLVEVYRFISNIIGQKLMKAMSEEGLSRNEIQDAIDKHRQKHPYELE